MRVGASMQVTRFPLLCFFSCSIERMTGQTRVREDNVAVFYQESLYNILVSRIIFQFLVWSFWRANDVRIVFVFGTGIKFPGIYQKEIIWARVEREE